MFIGVGSIILPLFSPHRWGQWPQLANRATPRSELSWSPCGAVFQVWCRRLHWFAFLVMNNVLLLLLPFFQFVFVFVFVFFFFFFLLVVCGDDSIVTIIKSKDDSNSSHKWKETMLLGYKTLNNLVPLNRRKNIIPHNLTIMLKNSTTINILTFLKNFSHHMQLIWLKKKWFKTKIYSLPRKKKEEDKRT